MKVVRYFLSVAVFLTLPISGPSSPSPPGNPVVEKVWELFQQSRFDTPIRGWIGLGGSDDGTRIKEFHGNSSDMRVDGEWCYRVIEQSGPVRAEWAFYALSLDPPLACRDERFQAIASGFPAPVLEAIRQELEARLSSRYGPSHEPEKKYGGYGEFGSAGWRNVRQWATPGVQIYLYISNFGGERANLGLLARHHHLRNAISAERKAPHWWKYGRWMNGWGTPLDQRLAEELGSTFPNLPPLLVEELPYPREESKNEDLQTTLQVLLEKAATAPPERRPALLLAADRLAGRWDVAQRPSEGLGKIRKQFGPYQLNYEWNHLGSNWVYWGDLRRQVWQDYADTEWGEFAFVLFLSTGWDGTIGCAKGSDQFREVIERGEEFLSRRPHGKLMLDIVFMLAQAYETWWSAGQASIQDSYVDRFQYQEKAARAREKAIDNYEEVMRLAPEGYEADYARRHLPRLKLAIDTNQRRFFCIYD